MGRDDTPVSAASLVPEAYAELEEEETKDSERVKLDSSALEFDLGHRCVSDGSALDERAVRGFKGGVEHWLAAATQTAAQHLIASIWSQPIDRDAEEGPIVTLPAPTLRLPRSKPPPAPKKETKWEAYRREKGVRRRKRDTWLYDEEHKQWRPRYGFNRKGDKSKQWLMEVRGGQDPMEDPWQRMRMEKAERVMRNKTRQLGNMLRSQQSDVPSGIPAGVEVDYREGGRKRGKKNIDRALKLAQRSTASVGKFDREIRGEKKDLTKGKKRRFTAVERAGVEERSMAKGVLRRVLGGKKPMPLQDGTFDKGPQRKRARKSRKGAPIKNKKRKLKGEA